MAAQESRALWASINKNRNTTYLHDADKIVLVSWRMLPQDTKDTAFDLYRAVDGVEEKINTEPIKGKTNYQDISANHDKTNTYRLTYAGKNETIGTYTLDETRVSKGYPYISIPLQATTDIHATYPYEANDVSVGDLDGDGEYEIVLKRCINVNGGEVSEDEDGEDTGDYPDVRHTNLLEAYKLDGTFLWRICSGPNIILGNSWSFAVADFDGDGKAEVAFRSSEGTVFGDGTEIGDVDGDGKTYYRKSLLGAGRYIGEGPEFISVVDGESGRELARDNYIDRETSESWGDNYWKRASSYRIAVANVSGTTPSVIICRGVYGRTVLEAWDFDGTKLAKRWHFDTDNDGYHSWESQGFHSLSVGDVDGDGYDEIVYGSATIDHDGSGLNNSLLGHGDALHLGKFDPDRDGLQIWSCFETGKTQAALRDAATGEVIWSNVLDKDNDTGRALVADIDPDSYGCECWWAGSNAHSIDGKDLGYKPKSCNMAIWFSGSLNRQMLDGTTIDSKETRVFTMHGTDSKPNYNCASINSSKKNPSWYGDLVGDWREEVILPVRGYTTELRIFSTWFPTDYAFPWLMTDHIYEMSALNQNVGYNQPNQLSYYLGSDMDISSGIEDIETEPTKKINDGKYYSLTGMEVKHPSKGIYIHNGKKIIIK